MLVPESTDVNPREKPICIVGAGFSGLITAHTLLQDGFQHVQILTRDKAAGGVWMDGRVYPGLQVNSLHGEFSFSSLPMAETAPGERLSGEDLKRYMRTFADKFLDGKIRFETEVVKIKRGPSGVGWQIDIKDLKTDARETHEYSRVVLCTGGCSNPRVPDSLSPSAAGSAHFSGPVIHTQDFNSHVEEVLSLVKPRDSASVEDADSIVVVGGGRSAQDVSAYLANQGRKVTVVFEDTDAILGSAAPMPDYLRKSRLLSLFSPHSELRTLPERFLHTTWIGSKIVRALWAYLTESAYKAFNTPPDSPLRIAPSVYWYFVNDEGVPNPKRFHTMVNSGKIEVAAPARVQKYGDDGHSVVLKDGRTLKADAVILATGYKSSWTSIFDDQTIEELGLKQQPLSSSAFMKHQWNYKTLADPPATDPEPEKQQGSMTVRGMVPAKNILRRDFAINGATLTYHNSIANEVSAHWISSYFLGDKMRIPATVDEALEHGERNAAWIRQRWPEALPSINESYSTAIATWNWPQWVDDLLEDMELPTGRSGGNWLTWPFKVISSQQIATLKDERDAKRKAEKEA